MHSAPEAAVEAAQAAAQRTRAWLDANVTPGGRCADFPDDAVYYFKLPYMLVKASLRRKAAAVAGYIADHLLLPDGDLAGGPAFDLSTRIYALGWVALGATMVERYDLARLVTSRLAAWEDPLTAAFLWPEDAVGDKAGDIQTAGGAMMGLVPAGKLPQAGRLAKRFAAHLALQDNPRRLSYFFLHDGSHAPAMPGGWLREPYDLDKDQQLPAALAPLVLGLVWLARATGRSQYIETASRYVEFVYRGAFAPSQFARTTKFGWAMLELYKATGDERLLQRVQDLASVLVSWQAADGLWDPRPVRQTPIPWERLNFSADCAMTVFALADL